MSNTVVPTWFESHPLSRMANGTSAVDADTPSNGPQVAQAPGLSFQLPHPSNDTDPLIVLMPDAPHAPRSKRSDFQDILHPTPMFIAFSIIPIVLLVGALVTFVFVWIRQRRSGQLKRLYLTDHPMIYPRRPVPKSLNTGEDLEDAVQTLSYEQFRSEKPLDDSKESKSSINRDRLKRRERRDEHEREMQGRVPAPAGPRALPPHAHSAQRDPANPFSSTSDDFISSSRPTSYVPEPRNLTESYFPSMDLSSHTARVDSHGRSQSSGFGEGHDGSVMGHNTHDGLYGHGMRFVESPMGMSPPPPSVTKLSERLHLRSRSESASGRGGSHVSEREEGMVDS